MVKTFNDLTPAAAPADGDYIPAWQNGAAVKMTVAQLAAKAASGVNTNTPAITALTQQQSLDEGVLASVQNTQTQQGTTLTSIQALLATLQSSVTALQARATTDETAAASVANRVTVLETATPPPVVPNAPTGLNATSIGSTTLTMSLTPPATGPTPVSYVWQYATPQGSGNWQAGGSSNGTTISFAGLIAGTPYDVRATSWSATNPGGVSAVYKTTTSGAPPVVTVPQAPTGLAVTTVAVNSLSLSLVAPVSGSPATSYIWSYRTPTGSGPYTVGPTSSGLTTTINGLASGTAYDIIAAGVNSAGTGASSAVYTTSTAVGTSISADGTKMPPASSLLMMDGTTVTLVGGVVQGTVAGVTAPMGFTSNVTLCVIDNGGVLFQENNVGGWWYWDKTQSYPWIETTAPPSVAGTPTPPTPASNPNVTVDLGTLTGKSVSKNVWGFASGLNAAGSFAQFLSNGNTFITTCAKLRPTYLRINANEDVLRRYGQGNTGIFDQFFSTMASWADPSLRVVLGVGPSDSGDTGVTPAQWGAWTTTLLNHFKAINKKFFDLEVGNETNDIDMNYYCAMYNAISDAAYAADPTILVGGTCADWWGHMDVGKFMDLCAAKIGRNGFFSFHSYPASPANNDASLYGIALGFSDVQSIRNAMNGTAAAHAPIRINEYGIDGDWQNPDPREGQIQGALYDDLLLTHCYKTDEKFDAGGRWDIVMDGYYGAIGSNSVGGDMTKITPQGWHKGISGQLMKGPEVNVTTTLPNVQCLAVKGANGFAVKLTNYGFADQTLNLGVIGGTVGVAKQITLTSATSLTNGPSSVTLSALGGLTLPQQSIVWITG